MEKHRNRETRDSKLQFLCPSINFQKLLRFLDLLRRYARLGVAHANDGQREKSWWISSSLIESSYLLGLCKIPCPKPHMQKTPNVYHKFRALKHIQIISNIFKQWWLEWHIYQGAAVASSMACWSFCTLRKGKVETWSPGPIRIQQTSRPSAPYHHPWRRRGFFPPSSYPTSSAPADKKRHQSHNARSLKLPAWLIKPSSAPRADATAMPMSRSWDANAVWSVKSLPYRILYV